MGSWTRALVKKRRETKKRATSYWIRGEREKGVTLKMVWLAG